MRRHFNFATIVALIFSTVIIKADNASLLSSLANLQQKLYGLSLPLREMDACTMPKPAFSLYQFMKNSAAADIIAHATIEHSDIMQIRVADQTKTRWGFSCGLQAIKNSLYIMNMITDRSLDPKKGLAFLTDYALVDNLLYSWQDYLEQRHANVKVISLNYVCFENIRLVTEGLQSNSKYRLLERMKVINPLKPYAISNECIGDYIGFGGQFSVDEEEIEKREFPLLIALLEGVEGKGAVSKKIAPIIWTLYHLPSIIDADLKYVRKILGWVQTLQKESDAAFGLYISVPGHLVSLVVSKFNGSLELIFADSYGNASFLEKKGFARHYERALQIWYTITQLNPQDLFLRYAFFDLNRRAQSFFVAPYQPPYTVNNIKKSYQEELINYLTNFAQALLNFNIPSIKLYSSYAHAIAQTVNQIETAVKTKSIDAQTTQQQKLEELARIKQQLKIKVD